MNRYITISALTPLVFVLGCDYYLKSSLKEGERLEARRIAVYNSARQSVGFAQEFEQLFSGGWTSADEGRLGWHYYFEVGLYGRYVVKGKVPLKVDTNTMTVVGAGSPSIHVAEIGRIIPSDEEVGGSAKFTTNQAQLGPAEWRKLIDSQGDFSVVGYSIVTNMPLPHFTRICRFPGSVNR